MKKILIFGLLGLVLVGSSVGGALFFTGFFNESDAAQAPMEEQVEQEPKAADAIYFEFDPDFTVNFQGKARIRFLQIGMAAVAYDEATIEALKLHMPVVRNDLLLLFSEQRTEQLSTREGKDAIRMQALSSVQGILKERFGNEGIEDVYFTRFVMQ